MMDGEMEGTAEVRRDALGGWLNGEGIVEKERCRVEGWMKKKG